MFVNKLLQSLINAISSAIAMTVQSVNVPSQRAGESYYANIDITEKPGAGYYPIGIVGVTSTSTVRSIQSFRISESGNNSGKIVLRVKSHTTSSNAAAVTYNVYILWSKRPLSKITIGGVLLKGYRGATERWCCA